MNGLEPNQKYANIPPIKPDALDYVHYYASILSILFIILCIINRVKSTKDPKKEVNRKRRMKIYKMKEMIHLLMDIIDETRFFIKTEENGNNISIDKRVIQSAVIDSITNQKSEIKMIGHKLHEILMFRKAG